MTHSLPGTPVQIDTGLVKVTQKALKTSNVAFTALLGAFIGPCLPGLLSTVSAVLCGIMTACISKCSSGLAGIGRCR